MKNKLYLIITAILALLISGCNNDTQSKKPAIKTKLAVDSPFTKEVKATIDQAADYLANTIQPNGMFEYRINMDLDVKIKRKYNILRHAGSIYALGMYYDVKPYPKTLDAMKQATTYIQQEAIGPLPDNDEIFTVWSKPEVNNSGNMLQAKLGGAGLGLVALLKMESIEPGFTPMEDLRKIAQFIVYMQKNDGSYYSKYIPKRGGKRDEWTSLYYPGEAALGLATLYQIDPDDRWLNSAAKTLEFLANSRKDQTTVPADHWALLATEKLLALNKPLPVSKELIINHAIQVCESIMMSHINDPSKAEYDGGFSPDGRTTPTATRLEGLLAALNFLPADLAITKQVEVAVKQGIEFLIRAQVKEGEYAGAMPRAIKKLPKDAPGAKKFNRRANEVRIDYVQHALSAMIQYVDFANKTN